MRTRSQLLYSCTCERFLYSQDQSAYLAAAKLADQSWEYISIAHRYMNVETWRQKHYNSVLEIRGQAVSFLGIHKSEPDIYFGFSPALHLQNKT